MNDVVLILVAILGFVSLGISIALLARVGKNRGGVDRQDLERLERSVMAARKETAEETARSLEAFSRSFRDNQNEVFSRQDQRIGDLTKNLNHSLGEIRTTLDQSVKGMDARMSAMNSFQEKNAEALRNTVDTKLNQLRQDNEKNLGEIRQSVEEKLQSTLEDRISRSFKEVSERLQQVYQGLGEMQSIASGVGDLKKVLTNVKNRGILGEIQLGAILEDILAPDQYETNVVTVPGSRNPVEYAIRLPGDGEGVVYLPIDSKFPVESYVALQDAYDAADPDLVKEAKAQLERSIKAFAKDIHSKYVSPPSTTDFAIMFLPTEGLYAEVVRMGLVEPLQRTYKINIAGPTTMSALLNSLQTGFRTLAIQKRSSEVWEVLGAVRTEFEKFESILRDTQHRLHMASNNLEELVGVRTRQMQRKLKQVSTLPADRAENLLKENNDAEE